MLAWPVASEAEEAFKIRKSEVHMLLVRGGVRHLVGQHWGGGSKGYVLEDGGWKGGQIPL